MATCYHVDKSSNLGELKHKIKVALGGGGRLPFARRGDYRDEKSDPSAPPDEYINFSNPMWQGKMSKVAGSIDICTTK